MPEPLLLHLDSARVTGKQSASEGSCGKSRPPCALACVVAYSEKWRARNGDLGSCTVIKMWC